MRTFEAKTFELACDWRRRAPSQLPDRIAILNAMAKLDNTALR
jgi:hypothetical protein